MEVIIWQHQTHKNVQAINGIVAGIISQSAQRKKKGRRSGRQQRMQSKVSNNTFCRLSVIGCKKEIKPIGKQNSDQGMGEFPYVLVAVYLYCVVPYLC